MPTIGNASIARFGDCYTSTAVVITAGAAVGLGTGNYAPTAGKGKGLVARMALINLETNDIRFHLCGTPAAACGMLMTAGSYLFLNSPDDIQNFKAIKTAAGNATAVVFLSF